MVSLFDMNHISDIDIYNYTQCKYRVFNDKNTTSTDAVDVGIFMTLMWNMDAIDIESKLKRLRDKKDKTFISLESDTSSKESILDSTKRTQDALKKGTDYIYNPTLFNEGVDSLFEQQPGKLASIPLLIKMQGKSKLGDYTYAPVLIQSGTGMMETDWGIRANPGYQQRLNFHAQLLGHILDTKITKGFVYDMTNAFVPYDLNEDNKVLSSIIGDISIMIKGETAHREPVISSTCDKCPWKKVCRKQAEEKNQLTLLFYLGEKVRDGFYSIGIHSMDDLAKSSTDVLWKSVSQAKYKGQFYKMFDRALLDKLVLRARLYVKHASNPEDDIAVIHNKPDFPQHSKEIHYDIEDDSLGGFVYLHGFWIIENGKEPYYEAFFADKPDEEKELSERLWQFFKDNAGVPMYHYSGHEAKTCKKLMEKYNLDETVYKSIFGSDGSAIDLYEWVVANTDWPLTSYGLKPICKYTGFNWSAEDAGGAQSVDWFYAFQKGDASMKDKIIIYNKEDCMATAHLKKWIINYSNKD